MFKDSYKLLLVDLIKDLYKFPCKKGGEGTVFFVNNDFVVKKYDVEVDRFVNGFFDGYCKEMQRFNKNGIKVPKIYSWVKVPILDEYGKKRRFEAEGGLNNIRANDYYILEEYISDRQLYHDSLRDCYNIFKDNYSRDEFDGAINNPTINNELLYLEIVKNFVDDYVFMNEYLCDVSMEQIDEFLYNTYVMLLDGRYSMPDVFSANVMINSKNLTLIDNKVKIIYKSKPLSKKDVNCAMVSGIINMFYYNNFVTTDGSYHVISHQDENVKSILNKKRDRVTFSCKSAMIRMLKRMNSICGHPVVSKDLEYSTNYSMLRHMLSKDDANEVYSYIEAEKE